MLRERLLMNIWCLLLLLQIGSIHQVVCTTYESDTTALEAVSKGWTQPNLGWSSSDPCAQKWRGVTCDSVQNSNVTRLILNSAGITGRLLNSIGNFVNLEFLDLSFNPHLEGTLPSSLANLQNLKTLNLQACGFTGSIPPEIGTMKKLEFLALNMNKLSGIIPPELGGLESVYWFDLAQNGIAGPLPISSANLGNVGLDNLTNALHFHLNNNSFSGIFPKEICILPKLIHLLLDSNDFSGKIPVEIGNYSNLQILRLDNNKFEGSFPSTISQVSTLVEIHTKNNKLSGALPDLSGLQNLMLLRLGMNAFEAQPLPTSYASLPKLQTLEIEQGNLVGEIRSTLFESPSLESVNMMSNSFSGTLNLSAATNSLASVNLDQNNITDLIGTTNQFDISLVGNPVCHDVRYHLSSLVCKKAAPENWIANTSCSFNAPTFATINQATVDVLRNLLSNGLSLASDQVWVSSANYTDNHRLIASYARINLDYYGPYALATVINSFEVQKGTAGLSAGAIAGISAAGCVLLLLSAAAALYAVRQKRRADKALVSSNPFASWGSSFKDHDTAAPQLKGSRFFSYAELKKASENFSRENEIGQGGYGKVYRGQLLTGEEMAIKRAQEGSMQGSNEFKTEIELLSRVHHRNLVGLIGFCYDQGEQMLVYEYMSNGTLMEHLRGHFEVLSWRARLEIAVGSAKGLAYLHEFANPPIIHRDIKSSNILLDNKFVAKVADFGLSKLAPANDGKGHVSTQVKGTLGYLDPEYYMTQQLTEKSDVYSFGVVLLELITARLPIEGGKYVVREVKAALVKGGVAALKPLLDPSLKDFPYYDLETLVDLALQCVEECAAQRPMMNDIVKQLEILLDNVSSSGFLKDSSRRSNTEYLYGKESDPFHYSGGFPHSVELK